MTFRKRCRRELRSWLIRASSRALSRLPLPLACGLGRLSAHLSWFISDGNRRLTLEHLAFAFPELSDAERRRIGRASFLHLAEGLMEAICIRQIDPMLEDYVDLSPENRERMRAAMETGRGFVFATGHMGHWELLARRIAQAGFPPVVIAKRSWNPRIDDAVDAFRREGRVTTLWRDDPASGRMLLNTMRQGKPLGILIDQDTQVQGVFVPFFGRPAHTPRAAADLALRFGAPLFVGWSRRRPDRRGYLLELEPVPYDPDAEREAEVHRVTAACTARLEAVIREHPSEWVWMHRRWKTQPGPQAAAGLDEGRQHPGSADSPPCDGRPGVQPEKTVAPGHGL